MKITDDPDVLTVYFKIKDVQRLLKTMDIATGVNSPNNDKSPVRASLIVRKRIFPSYSPDKERNEEGSSYNLTSRKGSFLYRQDDKDFFQNVRHSFTSNVGNQDDIIVTPFAQILSSLKNVRQNIAQLPKSSASINSQIYCHSSPQFIPRWSRDSIERRKSNTETAEEIITNTLSELDWCLEQLETMHTHKSVSDLTTSKFKRMLNKELAEFTDTDSTDNQVSEYLFKTFVGSQDIPTKQHSTSHITNTTKERTVYYAFGAVKECDLKFSSDVPRLGVDTPHEEKLAELLGDVNKWGFDIFRLSELSLEKPLVVIVYEIFKRRGLISRFKIPEQKLINYMLTIEENYHDNPYHNRMHAADVCQSVHVLLNAEMLKPVFEKLEVLAALFAAAIHDVDHPGLTNMFLVNTGSDLAIMYNDESVLENHHLAVAFKLLQKNELNFFCELNKNELKSLRRMVIDMVLATDMSKHMKLLADLKTMVEKTQVSSCGVVALDEYDDRILVLQNMIHCADLSNPTKPTHLYEVWTKRVMEEFFRQGDKERGLNLEISPMCDRSKADIAKSQIGFIEFIVKPLCETWAELVDNDANVMLENLSKNQDWFNQQVKENKEDKEQH